MRSSTSTSSRRAGRNRRRYSLWLLPLEVLLLVVGLHWADEWIADLLSGARPDDYIAFIDSRESFDPGKNYDVIAIGDSYIADAFVPQAFGAETGLKGFNFGVYNSSPFEWYYLARDLIDRGARPRYILIGTNPRMFGQAAGLGVHTFDFIHSLPLRIEMFWAAPGSNSLFKSVRHRYLLNTVMRRLTGGETPMPARRIEKIDNGYLENVRSMSAAPPSERSIEYQPLRPVAASRDQIVMLERLLDLLERHGIEPIFVNTPVHRTLLSRMELHEDYQAFCRTMADIAGRHRTPVFDGRKAGYVAALRTADFLNEEHLGASGARRFTTDLGLWFAARRGLLAAPGLRLDEAVLEGAGAD